MYREISKKNRKIRKMFGQVFQKIENFEKGTDKFIKKCKTSENVLANFPNN